MRSSRPVLNAERPSGRQMLQWLAHIAGYRIFRMSYKPAKATGAVQLVQVKREHWQDVHLAAQLSNGLALFQTTEQTLLQLRDQLGQDLDLIDELETGTIAGRKGMVFRRERTIAIVFEATKPNEMKINAWSHAKDKKWSVPYARMLDGRQVHSFYLDMWLGMRQAALEAISTAVQALDGKGQTPERILITGHSLGGGVSTLAIIDIIEHIRLHFGSLSDAPRSWACDSNLGNILRHITFAEFAGIGSAYSAYLNKIYEQYQIPAWDFVHPHDFTTRLHLPFFRAWKGHRHVLPEEAVKDHQKAYAAGRHDMLGYLNSVEWLLNNPREILSIYRYPLAAPTTTEKAEEAR